MRLTYPEVLDKPRLISAENKHSQIDLLLMQDAMEFCHHNHFDLNQLLETKPYK